MCVVRVEGENRHVRLQVHGSMYVERQGVASLTRRAVLGL